MTNTVDTTPSIPETELVQLLAHRYGDGLVYLRDNAEKPVYQTAIQLGLINTDGYLTPAGRALIARHGTD